jgi:hypothetical protein
VKNEQELYLLSLVACMVVAGQLYFLLYFSPSIIRMINSRRMGWAGHATREGEMRNANVSQKI